MSTTDLELLPNSPNPLAVIENYDPLCSQCKEGHLLRIFRKGYFLDSDLKFQLGSTPLKKTIRATSSCPICQIILAALDPLDRLCLGSHAFTMDVAYKQGPDRRTPLEGYSGFLAEAYLFNHTKYLISRGYFGLCAMDPSEYEKKPVAKLRLIETNRIDFDIMKGWLNTCQQEHRDTTLYCSAAVMQVERLIVIDCKSRSIISAPIDCTYVALSYVWGAPTEKKSCLSVGDGIPEPVPKTIEDAITVTCKLGCNYLWVDRYCVSQESKDEAHIQIQQMDLIYKSAHVTLFAVFGDDPDAGLPGVSTTPRERQYATSFAGLQLAIVPKDIDDTVASSKWNFRAWTFQEALFSRRRLFFTKKQVIFSCSTMYCLEMIYAPMKEFSFPVQHWVPCGLPKQPWDIQQLIGAYSARDLTYENDILNGFSGVLRAFQDIKDPIRHHWGVPILPINPTESLKRTLPLNRSSSDRFVLGLGWSSRRSGCEIRRSGFPSWSWTGWKWSSCSPYGNRWIGFGSWDINTDVIISIELKQGGLMSWTAFENAQCLSHDVSLLSPFLHIEAWTTTVHVTLDDDSSDRMLGFWNHSCVKGRDQHLTVRIHEEIEQKAYPKAYTGIILGDVIIIGHKYMILALDKGDYWERVGDAYLQSRDSILADGYELTRRAIRLG